MIAPYEIYVIPLIFGIGLAVVIWWISIPEKELTSSSEYCDGCKMKIVRVKK